MIILKNKYFGLLISSALIGLMADVVSVSDGYPKMFLGFWVGFLFYLPLVLFLFLQFLELTKIKNRFAVTFLNIILFIAVMLFAFWFFDTREGSGSMSDMYGLVYILGLVPASILGLVYGLYISFNINKK